MPALALAVLQAAPFLADLFFGDKTGNIVKGAADIVGTALGVDGSNADAVQMAIAKADPAALAALQAQLADYAKEVKLAEIAAMQAARQADKDEIIAAIAGQQDARQMSVEKQKIGGESASTDNKRKNLMIICDVIGLLSCLAAMCWATWMGTNAILDASTGAAAQVNPLIMALNAPLGILAGIFGTGLRDAHTFEFGSSRGSEAKTQLMAQPQQSAVPAPTA